MPSKEQMDGGQYQQKPFRGELVPAPAKPAPAPVAKAPAPPPIFVDIKPGVAPLYSGIYDSVWNAGMPK